MSWVGSEFQRALLVPLVYICDTLDVVSVRVLNQDYVWIWIVWDRLWDIDTSVWLGVLSQCVAKLSIQWVGWLIHRLVKRFDLHIQWVITVHWISQAIFLDATLISIIRTCLNVLLQPLCEVLKRLLHVSNWLLAGQLLVSFILATDCRDNLIDVVVWCYFQ